MATMFCFITTDLKINQELLNQITKECIEDSFNLITVDGDMSTNDVNLGSGPEPQLTGQSLEVYLR